MSSSLTTHLLYLLQLLLHEYGDLIKEERHVTFRLLYNPPPLRAQRQV